MEKFESISKKDAVSEQEKEAFIEMQRIIELGKDNISEDPQLEKEIEEMIETLLTEREKIVIRGIFLKGKSLGEIGKSLEVSPERIRQIEVSALQKLRRPEAKNYVKGFELKARGNDFDLRLKSVYVQNYLKAKENIKMEEVFRKILFLTRGSRGEKLCKLDSLIFNKIKKEIDAITAKNEYNNQDAQSLEEIVERLKLEMKKV